MNKYKTIATVPLGAIVTNGQGSYAKVRFSFGAGQYFYGNINADDIQDTDTVIRVSDMDEDAFLKLAPSLIDWDDFKDYLEDIATGCGPVDKLYFQKLAADCDHGIMTEELSIWHDKGDYRK